MELEQNSHTVLIYLELGCAETLRKDALERREHSRQGHNSGTQQRNVPSGNGAPQTRGPARCRCVCVHTHTRSLAEELCCSLSLPVAPPVPDAAGLAARGWSPMAVSGSVRGGKMPLCAPDARDRASVVEGCKTGANYASWKLGLRGGGAG